MEDEEAVQVEHKSQSSANGTELTDGGHLQLHRKDDDVLKFLDSMNAYLILMDSLSSKLRQVITLFFIYYLYRLIGFHFIYLCIRN